MKATLYWWFFGPGQMQKQEFEDYESDEFDIKLTELENDDSVMVIEIKKEKC